MKKKLLAVLFSFCLAALQLTGCGNNVEDASGISQAEQTTESTTTTSETTQETTTTTESAVEASGSLATSETSETTTSETTTTTTTTSETTTTTTQQTTTTTKAPAQTTTAPKQTSKPAVTTKPAATTKPAPVTTKTPAASSSNVKFYQDRVYVAGDSIAYGFCAYGYIPYEHNIAKGSLAMRNYTETGWFNEFEVNGRTVKCMDAIIAKQPRLLYVSMGMNDVNLTSAQTYASNYVGFIRKVRASVPNCIIVAANITPIASFSNFTGINTIRNANAAMQTAVKALNDPNVILFDAYSVVSAGGTYMANGYSAGDGIHLAGHVYPKILSSLAVVLDQYGVKERLS